MGKEGKIPYRQFTEKSCTLFEIIGKSNSHTIFLPIFGCVEIIEYIAVLKSRKHTSSVFRQQVQIPSCASRVQKYRQKVEMKVGVEREGWNPF